MTSFSDVLALAPEFLKIGGWSEIDDKKLKLKLKYYNESTLNAYL
jgi:hypothetical protein